MAESIPIPTPRPDIGTSAPSAGPWQKYQAAPAAKPALKPWERYAGKTAPAPAPVVEQPADPSMLDTAGTFGKEAAKGVGAGVVGVTGTILKGAAGQQKAAQHNAADFGRKQLEVMDRIDRGEAVPETEDAYGYQHLSPEQRVEARAGLEKAQSEFAPGTIEESALYGAGEATQDFATRNLAAAKEYEDSWTRSIAEGLGSTVPFLAAGVTGAGGSIVAGSALGTLASSGEAIDRAVQAGATHEQIVEAVKLGALPGLTEQMPIETLFERIPLPVAGRMAVALQKVLGQAFAEGGQEAVQQAAQNIIERYTYNPEQDITEGVAEAAAVGAAVGGILKTGGEVGKAARGQPEISQPRVVTEKQADVPPLPAPQEVKTAPLPPAVEAQATADERAPEAAAPAQRPEGEGVVESPPAAAPLPAVTSEERAILRKTQMTDSDIDIMSREEVEAEVERARGANVAVTPEEVAQAESYAASETEAETAASQETAPASKKVEPHWTEPEPPYAGERRPAGELSTADRVQPPESVADVSGVPEPETRDAAPEPNMAEREGTRDKPVRVAAPEDLDTAGQRVEPEPSDAQKEAGNYRKGHVRVAGLDITIENPKGSTRRGLSSDGTEWQVRMPAHYGYVKRSEGADGDQVDVYVGDDLSSKRVYVVDQVHPTSRRFDEHKAIMGVRSASEARELYARGFSDGRGYQRAGAITPMTQSEFKKWLAEGDTKRPLRHGRVKLTESGFPADAQGGVKRPKTLVEFLAESGGVRDEKGELRAMDANRVFIPGTGRLTSSRGVPLDEARRAAVEAGYLEDADYADVTTSTVDDLLQAIRRDIASRDVFSTYDEDWAAAWREDQARQEDSRREADERDRVFKEMQDLGYRGAPDDEYAIRVAEIAVAGNMDTVDAMERAAFELGDETGVAREIEDDIPFDLPQKEDADAVQPRATPADSESLRAEGESREDGGSEGEAEGRGVEAPERGEGGQDQRSEDSDEPSPRQGAEERKPEEVTTEPGAEGKPQTVIPGTERISQKEEAERKAEKPMRPKVEQKDPDGLFSDDKDQLDLVDRARSTKDDDKPVSSAGPRAKPREKGADKIDDFGEELHGARKHLVRDYAKTLSDDVDISAEPLSKAFPQPNYEKLAEAGVSGEVLALVAVMRDTIPNKPRKGYKLRTWAASVDQMRRFANELLTGGVSAQAMFDRLEDSSSSGLRSIAYTAKALTGIDPSQIPAAAKWRVMDGTYSMFMGQQFSPPKRMYFLQDANGRMLAARSGMEKTTAYDETLEGIVEKSRKLIQSALAESKAQEGGDRSKYTHVGVFRDRSTRDLFIAFKVRSSVIRLKSGFNDVKEARAYIEENRDELQAKIDEMRRGPTMRRDTNEPRQGRDRRDGDISPEAFSDAFGFRGVQFGNYVEGPRRQADLNRAYDALMDMADALDIPPRAVSLNGSLGLAFGARGRGGREAAAAHYEPGNIVINLTKGSGPGSLAHEWLHAIDNYFARQDDAGGYMSERRRQEGPVREDVYQAWKTVEKAINSGPFLTRSLEFDKARSKPYWSTTIELAARSFERYIVDRLSEKGVVNDYLANIDMRGRAYPTEEEMRAGIREAFDGLFHAIEHEETADGNVRLYSARQDRKAVGHTGALDAAARAEIRDIIHRVSGLDDVTFIERILVPQGIPAWGKEGPTTASGFYDPSRDAITIALDQGERRTAYHEAFHRLQDLFLSVRERRLLVAEHDRLVEIIAASGTRPESLSKMDPLEVQAEAFAIWSNQMDRGETGIRLHIGIRRAWSRIRNMVERVRNFLHGRGFHSVEDVFAKAREGKTAERPARRTPRDRQFSISERLPDVPARAAPKVSLTRRLNDTLARGVRAMKSMSSRDRQTRDDGETASEFMHRKWVDYLHPVYMMQQEVDAPLNELNDAYLSARLAEDSALANIQTMHDKYVTPMVDALVEGNASLEDLHRYLYAQHAEERNRVVGLRNPEDSDFYRAVTDPTVKGASGMSTQEARRILDDLRTDPEKFRALRKAGSHVRAMLDQSLKEQRRAGLINNETYRLLTEQWQNYVPLKGQDGQDAQGSWSPVSAGGFDVRGDEFKTALGRFSEADNIIANAVVQSEESVLRQKKNDVGKAMLRFLNQFDPKGERIAQVYWSGEEEFGDITKAKQVFKRVVGSDGKVTQRRVPNPFQNADDVLSTKVGGKTYYIRFRDPKVGHALRKISSVEIGTVTKLVRNITVWQSIVNTRANPAFTPINIIRDVQTGAVHLLDEGFKPRQIAGIVKNVPKAWRALWRHSTGKGADEEWDRWAKEFFESGGKITFHGYSTLEESLRKLEKNIAAAVKGEASPKAAFKAVLKFVGNLNDAGENGIRLAAYVAARKQQGRTAKEAAFLARDLTVDFKKRGEFGPTMNSWYVFFNAALQGNYNIARRLAKSKAVRAAVGGFIFAGMMQHVWNSLMAGEDDDGENYYAKMLRNEPWKVERQFVFFIPGTERYVSFPLPYGYNAFHHLGVQGAAVTSGDKDPVVALVDAARVAFDAFNPIGSGSLASMVSPTISDPAVELAMNENFFGGPIYPSPNPFDRAPPPDSQRAWDSTHPAFKALAEAVNSITGGSIVEPGMVDVHPDSLEHLWGFFTGGLGRWVTGVQETAVNAVQGEFEPKKAPWVRNFYGQVDKDSQRTEYFRQRERVLAADGYLKDYAERGIESEIGDFRHRHRVELEALGAFKSAEKARRSLNKIRRRVEADPELSASERKAELERLAEQEIEIMKFAREAYAAARRAEKQAQ